MKDINEKRFVEYAKSKGSQNFWMYPGHIRRAVFDALGYDKGPLNVGPKYPGLILSEYELSRFIDGLRIFYIVLEKNMEKDTDYRLAFKRGKDVLISYGQAIA